MITATVDAFSKVKPSNFPVQLTVGKENLHHQIRDRGLNA